MGADPTVVGGAGRPGASDDGIFAAIVFVVVSILLIATLPIPSERSAPATPPPPALTAGGRGAR